MRGNESTNAEPLPSEGHDICKTMSVMKAKVKDDARKDVTIKFRFTQEQNHGIFFTSPALRGYSLLHPLSSSFTSESLTEGGIYSFIFFDTEKAVMYVS